MSAELLPRAGVISGRTHAFLTRVYYEDTDAAGIVYYANYLKFAERARTELLRLLGFEQERLRREAGFAFAVRRCVAEYLMPARLDDELTVTSRLAVLGGATLEVEQRIRRGDADLVRLDVTLACVAASGRPVRLPSPLRAALSQLLPTSPVVAHHAR
jgi:acyl-CoA thioester hydrolase